MPREIIDFTRLDEIEREIYNKDHLVKVQDPDKNQTVTCKCGNTFILHCPHDPKNPLQLLCDDCIANLPPSNQHYPERSVQLNQLQDGAIIKDSDDGDYLNDE